MENETVVDEAINLIKTILGSLLPGETWAAINIYQTRSSTQIILAYPLTFPYTFDRIPELLRREGLFESIVPDYFVTKIGTGDVNSYDLLTSVARSNGYIGPDKKFIFTRAWPARGQYSMLVNVAKLKAYLGRMSVNEVKPPYERDYWYSNGILNVRLADGGMKQIDFSDAKNARMVFETFWSLWETNNVGLYETKQVLRMHNKMFGSGAVLEHWNIGKKVANVRSKKIDGKFLASKRILWEFDRKKSKWIFQINPLNAKS